MMNRILIIIVSTLFLYSCSTAKKKDIPIEDQDITWVENSDFTPVDEVPYVPMDDFYEGLDDKKENPIADEGLQTVDEVEHQKVTNRSGPVQGLILCYKGRTSEGINAITSNYRAYKKNPLYYNSLGTCFLKKGHLRKAIVFYNLALKIKSNYPPAINNLGVAYYLENNLPKAYSAFKEASEVAKDSKTPFYNLGVMFIRHYLINEFEIDRSDFLSDDLFLFGKGLYYIDKNEYTLAIKSLKRIKDPAKFSGAVQLNQAIGYLKLNNKREAKYLLSKSQVDQNSKLYSSYQNILSLLGDE